MRNLVRKQIPEVTILENTGGRRHRCKICDTLYERSLNGQYLRGYGLRVLAKMYDVDVRTIQNHVRALGLRNKRGLSTLKKVQDILRYGKDKLKDPDSALVAKALELHAKLTGELDERPVTNIGVAVVTDEERRRRLEAGVNRLGVLVESRPIELIENVGVEKPEEEDSDE